MYSGYIKLKRVVWTRRRGLGIINISVELAVVTVHEITQGDCEQ